MNQISPISEQIFQIVFVNWIVWFLVTQKTNSRLVWTTFMILLWCINFHCIEKSSRNMYRNAHFWSTESSHAGFYVNNEKMQAFSLASQTFGLAVCWFLTRHRSKNSVLLGSVDHSHTVTYRGNGGRTVFSFFSYRDCLAHHFMCVFELTMFYHSTTGP